MKSILPFVTLFFILLLSGCKENSNTIDRNITLNDTITTPSGLKYIFLKEGNGRQIEDGSKVRAFTELYINDDPEVFWTTTESTDSVFQFIHGKTKVIDGFKELNSYLVEGDSVIGILPPSIAYGDKEKNGVPVGSTLIYKPYYVEFVSEPKMVLKDTLITITKDQNVDAAISYYETIINSDAKNEYHSEGQDMYDVVYQLYSDSLYSETDKFSKLLLASAPSDNNELIQTLSYLRLQSLIALGNYEDAIKLSEPLSKQYYNQVWWHQQTTELKEKVAASNE